MKGTKLKGLRLSLAEKVRGMKLERKWEVQYIKRKMQIPGHGDLELHSIQATLSDVRVGFIHPKHYCSVIYFGSKYKVPGLKYFPLTKEITKSILEQLDN